jgi:hypothetical protein
MVGYKFSKDLAASIIHLEEFDPEEGGRKVLRNVFILPQRYTELQHTAP